MSPTGETPDRLQPTSDTLRELYLLSGNECAHPHCREPIIGSDGAYIAQVCHIASARPGGQRFDPRMTNEQRRAPANLVLLCYRHHVETNDEAAYPVDRIRKIKADHEARFAEGVRRLFASVRDWTQTSSLTPPETLRAFNECFGWTDFPPDEHAGNVAAVLEFAERLRALSLPARETLALILRRGRPLDACPNQYALLMAEVEDTTGMQRRDVVARVGQLTERGLAYIEDENPQFDDFAGPYVATSETTDYPSWQQIRTYCDHYRVPIYEIVVELRLDLLDEPPMPASRARPTE